MKNTAEKYMPCLTASKEDYIKTIYLLTRGGEEACITDIAAHMSVTKASASRAVSELERLGLVERFEKRLVGLTDEGIKHASKVKSRFEVICLFFTEVLDMNRETSMREACKLEHMLSNESLHAMRNMLNNAR